MRAVAMLLCDLTGSASFVAISRWPQACSSRSYLVLKYQEIGVLLLIRGYKERQSVVLHLFRSLKVCGEAVVLVLY